MTWVTRVKWYSRIHWLRSRNGTLHALGSLPATVLSLAMGHLGQMVLSGILVTPVGWYSRF